MAFACPWQAADASTGSDDDGSAEAILKLKAVYSARADLRSLFDPVTWLPTRPDRTGDIVDLEDWARRFGCQEQSELHWYCPVTAEDDQTSDRLIEPSLLSARITLREIYSRRGDLRSLFDPVTWLPTRPDRTGDIADLEDWAARYGYLEHDALWWYWTGEARRVLAGGAATLASNPRALAVRNADAAPVRIFGSADFRPSSVTAGSVFVVDVPTRQVLLAENADRLHPVASITKLMTGILAVDRGMQFGSQWSFLDEDEIGGARLRVPVGTTMTFGDLMYSMLVGSANNAAHAVGRIAGGGDLKSFAASMNGRAADFGLANTAFVDPSGLDVRNVSTARELAALALEAWDRDQLRRICSTAKYAFRAGTEEHTLTNTNELLTDPDNGLIVLGGKTGYLIESKWNLVVSMKDTRNRPVLLAVLGSGSRDDLFRDARTAAEWVWDSHRWP